MSNQDLRDSISKEITKITTTLLGFETSEKLEYINAYLNSLSIDTVSLYDLAPQELLAQLKEDDIFQLGHFELIANLLHQKALVNYEQDFNPFGHNLMKKAILILEHADKEIDVFSEERKKLLFSMKGDVSDEEEDKDDPLAF